MLALPGVREKFAGLVVEPGELIGERFSAYQAAQFARWRDIIKSFDIPLE